MPTTSIEYWWGLLVGTIALLFLALSIIIVTLFNHRKISKANRKFELLFNRVFDALIIFDEQGRIVDSNDSASQILGYSRSGLKNIVFTDLFPGDKSGPRDFTTVDGYVSESSYWGEKEILTNREETIIADCAAVIVEHEDSRYLIISFRDVSARRHAEDALRESEERYRAVWEYSPVGICLTDKDGIYHYANPAYCRLYGYLEEELIGRPYFQLILKEIDVESRRQYYNELFEEGKPLKDGETKFIKKNGEPIWIRYAGDFVRRNDKPIFLVALNLDVSEQKRVQQALEEETLHLQEKNAALHEVLSHIEEEKLKIKREIAEVVDHVLIPTLSKVANRDGTVNKNYLKLLNNDLLELGKMTGAIRQAYSRLTPREIEICDLIRNGASSKEISETLDLSLLTINKHRQRIRRKLVIHNKAINLTTYLRNLD